MCLCVSTSLGTCRLANPFDGSKRNLGSTMRKNFNFSSTGASVPNDVINTHLSLVVIESSFYCIIVVKLVCVMCCCGDVLVSCFLQWVQRCMAVCIIYVMLVCVMYAIDMLVCIMYAIDGCLIYVVFGSVMYVGCSMFQLTAFIVELVPSWWSLIAVAGVADGA